MSRLPFSSLTPRADTRASQFVEEHPRFDGTGVIVAILDTGVDVGAPGLQTTPSGAPKIVDAIDASGSGDVIMTATRTVKDGVIVGLSGRSLRVNPAWRNAGGVFRVGLKPAYDLFPAPLLRRVKAERADADTKALASALGDAQRAVADAPRSLDGEMLGELSKRVSVLTALSSSCGGSTGSGDDAGPLYDVVSWCDDESFVWRVAIDTRGDGDLMAARGLAPYRHEHEWGCLDGTTLLNYAIQVYNKGDVVSIVTDAGAHGTHVAGIVAAHHPGRPTECGVAPGAQIVSIRIGDMRLGSMETGTGLIRALKAIADSGAHVVNMSYGEPSSRCVSGRFLELLETLVLERGVIFCASAGNNGPALTTVGAPGGASPHILSVGAAVSQAMMEDQYALRARYAAAPPQDGGVGLREGTDEAAESANTTTMLPATPSTATLLAAGTPAPSQHDRAENTNFTWSSRGPAMDGGLGVSICAPGGAITSVPTWSLNCSQLMNGTSMSSPNAAGCVALLLSGLLTSKMPYTPHSIKRALENTASPIAGSPDAFTAGMGMVNVTAAWEHLQRAHAVTLGKAGGGIGAPASYPFGGAAGGHETSTSDASSIERSLLPYLSLTVSGGGSGVGEYLDRGIYLRDPAQTARASDFSISIKPMWQENVPNATKVAFQLRLALETSAGWVSVPTHILLANASRSFLVHVDPRRLAPGRAHFAEVLAYEVLDGEGGGVVGPRSRALGPLLRLPITVITAEAPDFGPSTCVYNFTPHTGGADLPMHTLAVGGESLPPPPPPPRSPCAPSGVDHENDAPRGLPLRPSHLHRRFIAIPTGATWAEVRVRRVDTGVTATLSQMPQQQQSAGLSIASPGPRVAAALEDALRTPLQSPSAPATRVLLRAPVPAVHDVSQRTFVVHAMQVVRGISTRSTAHESYLRLTPGEADGISLPLHAGGRTLECTVGQFWSSLGESLVEVSVHFHGVSTDADSAEHGLLVPSVTGFARLVVTPLLHDVNIRAVGKLTEWLTTLSPELVTPPGATAAALPLPAPLPDTSRDTLVNGKVAFALNVTYKLSLERDVSGACLRLPSTVGLLYESGVDAQVVLVVSDDTGRTVAAAEALGDALRIKAGEYTIHLQLRHEDASRLNALRNTGLALEFLRKLKGDESKAVGDGKEVPLTFSGAHPSSTSTAPIASRLQLGQPQVIYVSASASALPKGVRAGDTLKGFILLDDDVPRNLVLGGREYAVGDGGGGDRLIGRHPQGLAVTLLVQQVAPAGKPKATPPPSPTDVSSEGAKLALMLWEAGLARLKSLDPMAPSVATEESSPASQLLFGGAITTLPQENAFSSLSRALEVACPASHATKLHIARLVTLDDATVVKTHTAAPAAAATSAVPLDPSPVVAAATAAVASMDVTAIAAWFGLRHDVPASATAAVRTAAEAEGKRMGDAKVELIDVLWRRARALCAATRAAIEAGAALAPTLARVGPGSADSSAFTAGGKLSVPLITVSDLPPLHTAASGEAFDAAVTALAAWSPVAPAAGGALEGPHAPLLTLEAAIRGGRWATALDACAKVAAAGTKGDAKLPPRACAALRVWLLARAGWGWAAARAAEDVGCVVALAV